MSEQLFKHEGHEQDLGNNQNNIEKNTNHETGHDQINDLLAKDKIENIRKGVEQAALSGEDFKNEFKQEYGPTAPQTVHYITKHIKAEQYKVTLSSVRNHLSSTQRKLSKFIHNPKVETLSEIGSKSIARPSGLLGGSLVALSGSLTVIIISRKVGFEIPGGIIIMLFAVGFFIGLLVELTINRFSVLSKKQYRK